MGNTNTTQPQAYADQDYDHQRVAPMGRTPRKPRAVEDDIFVVNAGTTRTNGRYKKVYLTSKSSKATCGKKGGHLAERNGAGIYRNCHGFEISREIIDDAAGWILGKRGTQQAYYGISNASFLPPPTLWGSTWQFIGSAPCPTISLHFKDAVALGYDELAEAQEIEAALFEAEQKICQSVVTEMKKKRGTKMTTTKSTGVPTSSSTTTATDSSSSSANPKKVSKWNVVRSSKENSKDAEMFPVSPSRQRAAGRRQRPPALAWNAPERGIKKSLKSLTPLPQHPPSPIMHQTLEMSAHTQDKRTEKFTAKREERYQYYQKRLNKKGMTEVRSPLSNVGLNNKKRETTVQFV